MRRHPGTDFAQELFYLRRAKHNEINRDFGVNKQGTEERAQAIVCGLVLKERRKKTQKEKALDKEWWKHCRCSTGYTMLWRWIRVFFCCFLLGSVVALFASVDLCFYAFVDISCEVIVGNSDIFSIDLSSTKLFLCIIVINNIYILFWINDEWGNQRWMLAFFKAGYSVSNQKCEIYLSKFWYFCQSLF